MADPALTDVQQPEPQTPKQQRRHVIGFSIAGSDPMVAHLNMGDPSLTGVG